MKYRIVKNENNEFSLQRKGFVTLWKWEYYTYWYSDYSFIKSTLEAELYRKKSNLIKEVVEEIEI